MRTIFTEDELYEHWLHDARLNGYRVGHMSYGDWFLEPGQDMGEARPFNRGTLWLEFNKAESNRNVRIYTVTA